MRHTAVILLCMAGFAARASTVDYTVALDPNGFNVYEVTKDAVKKVTGSPFGSSLVTFIGIEGTYIYDVTRVAPKGVPYYTSEIITYTMSSGEPKQVAVLQDNAYSTGACGGCASYVTDMVATPDHLFMKMVGVIDGSGLWNKVHVYHRHTGGALAYMCDIEFNPNPIDIHDSPVKNIRVDANEFYAYLTYIDYDTQETKTGIYDISTSACKQVGTVGAAGVPVSF